MERAEIIRLVRHHLNDLDGAAFSDEELLRFLDTVTRDYFTRTAHAKGEMAIRLDETGRFRLPPEAVGVLRAWNDLGDEVRLGNEHEAEDWFPSKDTHIGMVCEDLDDDGTLLAIPTVGQSVYSVSPTKVPWPYGIVTQLYGMACAYDYGVPFYAEFFQHLGSLQYARCGEPEEVTDYLALVYGVCARALNTDADLSSANNASFYERLYQSRVGGRSIVIRGSSRAPRKGVYF